MAAQAAGPARDGVAEALRINAEARIRAQKIGFLLLSCVALLAITPCRWLPDDKPGDEPRAQPLHRSAQ